MGILLRIVGFIILFSTYSLHQSVRVVVPTEDWYTASVGSDFTARCESNGPVIWWKLGNEEVQLETHITKKDNGTIGELVLNDLTFRFVGFYDCLPFSRTSNAIDSFYLYVDDPAHLMVGNNFMTKEIESFQPVIVPCRPTAPDVLVKLLSSAKDFVADSNTRSPGPENKDIYFDPRRGFILPIHLMKPNYFICEFSKRGVIQEMHVDIYAEAISRMFKAAQVEHPENTQGETILAQAGETVVFTVDLYTKYRPFNVWSSLVTGQEAMFRPDGVFNERSNKIRTENTHGYPWESRLIINDVSEKDAGLYALYSYQRNIIGNKQVKDVSVWFYYLDVGVPADLTMNIPRVIKVNDTRSLHAFCLRETVGNIYETKWTFRPLDCPDVARSSCEEEVPTVDPLDIDEHSSKGVLSAVVLETPRPGNLTCSIYFEYRKIGSVTKSIVLAEVEDGFELRKLPKEDDEPNSVTLQCVTSKYLYSYHLYWIAPEGHVIEDNVISDASHYTKLTKSENEYSYMLELGIKKLNRSQGDYRCMAVNKNHKPEFKTYSMNSPVPVPPQFVANLGNNTLLVPSTSTVTLSCNSNANQTSATHWLKDDVEIGRTHMATLKIKNVTFKNSGKYTCDFSNANGSKFNFTQLTVYAPDTTSSEDLEKKNGLKANTLEQAVVHCHLYEQLPSKVDWYKNDEKLPESPHRILHDDSSMLVINPVRAKDAGLYNCKPAEVLL